tara:strand:- start:217 stop:339 length:123 start_codon:yes stop_codon:yes gene_type:complete
LGGGFNTLGQAGAELYEEVKLVRDLLEDDWRTIQSLNDRR